MTITLAFDVYGTLIDTHGVSVELEKHVGSTAAGFSKVWREKQLEYSFRRGLMQRYEHFSVCTAQALDYTDAFFKVSLSPQAKESLLNAYKVLPAFADVRQGLARAQKSGFRIFAFSNGSADAVEGLLVNAGIRDFFHGVVSVEEVQSFKPNPAVYSHFLKKSGAAAAGAWMVSGNPFDVIGALSSGMRAAWVRRSHDAVFDPWGIEPTVIVDSLTGLTDAIVGAQEKV